MSEVPAGTSDMEGKGICLLSVSEVYKAREFGVSPANVSPLGDCSCIVSIPPPP